MREKYKIVITSSGLHRLHVRGRAEEGVGGDEAVGEPPHDQRLQEHHREQQPDLSLPVVLNSVDLNYC